MVAAGAGWWAAIIQYHLSVGQARHCAAARVRRQFIARQALAYSVGFAAVPRAVESTAVVHAGACVYGRSHVPRVCRMWCLWIFTIPSLRARDCAAAEKDALNLLFLGIPLLNITLPLLWMSFPFIYTVDCVVMAAVYGWKLWLPAMEERQK